MSKSEYVVSVDRELKLSVEVTESGAVKLQLTAGYETVLGVGDNVDFILRPATPQEKQAPAPQTGILNSSFPWKRPSNGEDEPLVDYVRR